MRVRLVQTPESPRENRRITHAFRVDGEKAIKPTTLPESHFINQRLSYKNNVNCCTFCEGWALLDGSRPQYFEKLR